MSKLLDEELKKLDGKITQINENTYVLNANRKALQLNNKYIIKLNDSIFNPNSTLMCNWNKNNYPKSKYLLGIVSQKLGHMFKINAKVFDIETYSIIEEYWEG